MRCYDCYPPQLGNTLNSKLKMLSNDKMNKFSLTAMILLETARECVDGLGSQPKRSVTPTETDENNI